MKEKEERKLSEISTRILEDYGENREPFNKTVDPSLARALNKIDDEQDVALFITLTTALNFQRNSDEHYEKFNEILNTEDEWIFDPQEVVEHREHDELVKLFEEIETRFGEKDAEIWHEICHSLYNEFDSNPVKLLEENDYDAEKVEEYVREKEGETLFFGNRYPYLRGPKIRPLWVRFMNNSVHTLENMENPDIPVDTHIIKVTGMLTGEEYTESEADKEEIRQFWRSICEEAGFKPVRMDTPLWFVGNNWESWGEEYLREVMNSVGYEPRTR